MDLTNAHVQIKYKHCPWQVGSFHHCPKHHIRCCQMVVLLLSWSQWSHRQWGASPPSICFLPQAQQQRFGNGGRHRDGIRCPWLFLPHSPLSFPFCLLPYFCVLCPGWCINCSARSVVVVRTCPALPCQVSLGVLDCVKGKIIHGDPPGAAIAIATVNKLACVLPLDEDGQSQLQGALLPPCSPVHHDNVGGVPMRAQVLTTLLPGGDGRTSNPYGVVPPPPVANDGLIPAFPLLALSTLHGGRGWRRGRKDSPIIVSTSTYVGFQQKMRKYLHSENSNHSEVRW